MARLFITPREMNFISDITKEIIKDVNAQYITIYPISEHKTKSHDVYQEAVKKIFDQPIKVDALVDAKFQGATKTGYFGVDAQYQLEVFIQFRDMVDKGINIQPGDFFSFSDVFYEIITVETLKNIYGQAEHRDGIKIVGSRARKDQFDAILRGPTGIEYTDDDSIQKTFVQQRGEESNSEGLTGDKRELIDAGVIEPALTGPREVSERGALADDSHYESSFYGDED